MTGPQVTASFDAQCSFCGKPYQEVKKLIVGSAGIEDAYICDGCIETWHEIIEEEDKGQES